MEVLTKVIKNEKYKGERALFNVHDLVIEDTLFYDGESPLKESHNLLLTRTTFDWKYPLWYCNDVKMYDSLFTKNARAGVWYSNNIEIINTQIIGEKNFRRINNLKMENVDFLNAQETLWYCSNISLNNIKVKGDYFALGSEYIEVNNLQIDGNYAFDGCKNVIVRNAILNTKDAFWNCDNVVIYDSTIKGEYLAWNTSNITFINCHLESLQGLCYINNLKMINCTMKDMTLSFEYSKNIDAEINSSIDSIKNPFSGKITCLGVNTLIMEEDKIDINKTSIIIKEKM